MNDLNLRNVDADYLMGDLSQGGFHALTMRMHADAQLESAIRRH